MSAATASVSVGPLCTELGVTSEQFLNDLRRLAPLAMTGLSNGHILELQKHIRLTKTKWEDVKMALSQAYQKDWSQMPASSLNVAFIGLSFKSLSSCFQIHLTFISLG